MAISGPCPCAVLVTAEGSAAFTHDDPQAYAVFGVYLRYGGAPLAWQRLVLRNDHPWHRQTAGHFRLSGVVNLPATIPPGLVLPLAIQVLPIHVPLAPVAFGGNTTDLSYWNMTRISAVVVATH